MTALSETAEERFWRGVDAIVAGLALSVAGAAMHVVAQSPPSQPAAVAAPDTTKLGPQVGQKVPDFSLTDQSGRTRTLSSLMGPKGLVLVFSRSADW